ncbi:hypothetical protein HMPREF1142_2336 [Peptostreptococcaceae bacterium AS15]|nr:hypothetical protein HMPREF1142_2336 [Peptostreptococcaceae bacterium AS15]
MSKDKKTKLVKFLKVMAVYFGLYFFQFVFYPNTPLYNNSDTEQLIYFLSFLLFPLFDILVLESNFLYACAGILLYDVCLIIYNANGAYDIGCFGFFYTPSFSMEWLIIELKVMTVVYIVIYIIILGVMYLVKKIKKYLANDKKSKDEENITEKNDEEGESNYEK